MVLSRGGMVEREARDALKSWETVLAGEVYSLFVKQLCLGLLRARVRCCEP
jgi:hypothetical protein